MNDYPNWLCWWKLLQIILLLNCLEEYCSDFQMNNTRRNIAFKIVKYSFKTGDKQVNTQLWF